MNKLILSFATVLALGITTQTQAQNGSKEYNIHYVADVPNTQVKEQDQKIVALDKQLKAYETAAGKNDQAKMNTLKESILKWKTDNQSWINQSEPHLIDAINGWYENSLHSLRIFTNK